MDAREEPASFINLKDFIIDENIDILHEIVVNRYFKFKENLKTDFCLLNKDIPSQPDIKFWCQLENELNEDPSKYEKVLAFFDIINKSLRMMILNDSIMLRYLQSDDYCVINLNPSLNGINNEGKILQAKDKAIFVNIVEYANFIINMLRHISCHTREEEITLACTHILQLIEPLMLLGESEDNNIKTKKDFVSDLRKILRELSDVFYNVLYDFANFALPQIYPFVKAFVEDYERNAFAKNNPTFKANISGTNTYAWIEDNAKAASTKDQGEEGKGPRVKNYNAVLIDCYLDVLSKERKLPETLRYMDGEVFKEYAIKFNLLSTLINIISCANTIHKISGDNSNAEKSQISTSVWKEVMVKALDVQTSAVLTELSGTKNDLVRRTAELVDSLVEGFKSRGLNRFADVFASARNQGDHLPAGDCGRECLVTQLRRLFDTISNDKLPINAFENDGDTIKVGPSGAIEDLEVVEGKIPDPIMTLLQTFAEPYCAVIMHNKSVFHHIYHEIYKMIAESIALPG